MVDGNTAKPLADVLVVLTPPAGTKQLKDLRQLSDDRGRFLFSGLAPGKGYLLRASRSGYLEAAYGGMKESSADATAIDLSETSRTSLTVSMWRPGSIVGSVFDERGIPVVGVFVRALSRPILAGRRQLAIAGLTTTDDRGTYRIGNLPSGRYIVMVPAVQVPPDTYLDGTLAKAIGHYPIPPMPSESSRLTYPISFAGNTTSVAEATEIDLELGAERVGVDIRLSLVPATRLVGTADGALSELGGIPLRLLAKGLEDIGIGNEVATARVSRDGRFDFGYVPWGEYTIESPLAVNEYSLQVSFVESTYAPQLPPLTGVSGVSRSAWQVADGVPQSPWLKTGRIGSSQWWAQSTVTVGSETQNDVHLTLHRGSTVSGVLDIETETSSGAQDEPTVILEPADGGARLAIPRGAYDTTAPHRFHVDRVLPGRYVVVSATKGWQVRTVTVKGADVGDRSVDVPQDEDLTDLKVTLTNRLPELRGHVDSPREQPGHAKIVVFPSDRERWVDYGASAREFAVVRTTSAGDFTVRGLPAGNYRVVALPSLPLDWQAPEHLAALSARARVIRLDWGQVLTLSIDLRD